MIANQPQRNLLLALSREPNASAELLSKFFTLPDWNKDPLLQLRVQQTITHSKDVDSAIKLLSHIEFLPNIAFDFNEIMNLVTGHGDAAQAYLALTTIQLAPSALLQEVIISKGDVSQHGQLMDWQLASSNMDVKIK